MTIFVNREQMDGYHSQDKLRQTDLLIEAGRKVPRILVSLDLDNSVLYQETSVHEARSIALSINEYRPEYAEHIFFVLNSQKGADQLLKIDKYKPFTEIAWNVNDKKIKMPFMLCEWSYIAIRIKANILNTLPAHVLNNSLFTELDDGDVLVKYIPKEIKNFYNAQNSYKVAVEILIGKDNFNWEEERTVGISLQPTEKGILQYGVNKFTEEESVFYYQFRFGYDPTKEDLQAFKRKISEKEHHTNVGKKDRAKYRMTKKILDGKNVINTGAHTNVNNAYDKLINNDFYEQSSIKLGADIDIVPAIVGREGKAFILNKFIEFYNNGYHPMFPITKDPIGWNDILLLEDNYDAGKAITDKMMLLNRGGIILPALAESALTNATYYYKLEQMLFQYDLLTKVPDKRIESVLAAIELCTHRVLIERLVNAISYEEERNNLFELIHQTEKQKKMKTIFCVGQDISANVNLIKAGHSNTDVFNNVPIEYNTDLIEGLDHIKDIALKNPNLMLNSSIIIKINNADEYYKLNEFFKALKHTFSIFGISRPNLSILILKPYLVDNKTIVQIEPLTDDQKLLCGKRNGNYKFCMFQYKITERDDVAQVNHRITSLLLEAI